MKYFALWSDGTGKRCWAGPFPSNTNAKYYLEDRDIDVSGGWLIAVPLGMTPGEKREALPLLEGTS
jgi:hypothetical protein